MRWRSAGKNADTYLTMKTALLHVDSTLWHSKFDVREGQPEPGQRSAGHHQQGTDALRKACQGCKGAL